MTKFQSERKGETAEAFFSDSYPSLCSHDIPASERSCDCGARIGIVVAPLQLALFEWPRVYGRYQYRSRPRTANEGFVIDDR